jgi:hypothetical protein
MAFGMGGRQRRIADFFTSFGAAIGVTKNEGKINYGKALDTRHAILNTQQPTKKSGQANEGMDQDAQPEDALSPFVNLEMQHDGKEC